MRPADRPPLGSVLAAGALAAAFFLQSFLASLSKSPTFDEPAHISAGLSYWRTGQFGANLQHPPLLKEIGALPLVLQGVPWPQTPQAASLVRGARGLEYPIGFDILNANGPDRVLFWSRLPFAILGTLLGVVLYLWGRMLVGDLAALGALLLYACSPTMLAHASLVTTDVGSACFTVLFLAALWRYLCRPSPLRLVQSGLALGAALTAKFSAILLVPVGALLMLAALRWPPTPAAPPPERPRAMNKGAAPRRRVLPTAYAFLGMCLVAIVVIEIVYFFPRNPLLYWEGIQRVNADHDPNFLLYLGGALAHRFASYFAVAYLVKEPLPGALLACLGLVSLLRSRTVPTLQKLFLVAPPVALFGTYALLADNLGIRYLIPILPFTYLWGGLGVASLLSSATGWRRAAAGMLAAWAIVAVAGIYPDHLAYFNEVACLPGQVTKIGLDGGTRCGPLWLDDHNVDWGQGLKQLKAWLDRDAAGRTVRFAYFGSFPPESYGIAAQKIHVPDLLKQPEPGLYAVSAHFVARVPALGEQFAGGAGAWLRRRPPTAVVGHSIYIYDVH
jgi:hypothetical protein